jgi:hypothetical protein
MATASGFAASIGAGKESTYGASVTVNECLPFISEGVNYGWEMVLNEFFHGQAGYSGSDQGNKSVVGPIDCHWVYDTDNTDPFGNGLMHGIALGAASFAASANTYTLAEDPTNSVTINIDKVVSRWVLDGVRVQTLTISGTAGQAVTANYEVIAQDIARSGTAFPSLTTDTPNKTMFDQLTFRVGDLTDALGSGDDTSINNFTLTLNNNLATDHHYNVTTGEILEAKRNGRRDVTFSFTLPRYEADTYIAFRDNDTKLQANLSFTDGTYTNQIYLTTAKITDIEANIADGSIVSHTVTMKCFRRDTTNNTHDTTTTEEFYIKETNARTASPLA